MASPLYIKVVNIASKYLDSTKAKEILERQLVKCGSSGDTFNIQHLTQVQKTLVGAIQLYLTDNEKCRQVADEIQAIG